MAIYSILSQTGLNAIHNATSSGMLIEASYWVGIYDVKLHDDYINGRIDKYQDIRNYLDSTNADNLKGDEFYYYTESSFLPTPIPNITRDNLYRNVTYQPVVTDICTRYKGYFNPSSGVFPDTAVVGDYWESLDSGTINGIYFSVGDRLAYNGVDFINATQTPDEYRRANFKINISDKNKPLQINKIAIYGTTRTIDGTMSGQPFLLGQVIIPVTQIIQPLVDKNSTSVDSLIVDFQLDAQASVTNFNEIFLSSETDYWQRVTNNAGQFGLLTEGQVYISNNLGVEDRNGDAINASDVGVAKVLISTFATVNKHTYDEEAKLPQLVLQYVDNDREYTENNGSAFAPRVRTTMRTNPLGHLEIDMYGSCNPKFSNKSLISASDGFLGLGNRDNRWGSLYIKNDIELFSGNLIDVTDNNVSTKNIVVKNNGNDTINKGDYVVLDRIGEDGIALVSRRTKETESSIGICDSDSIIPSSVNPNSTGYIKLRKDGRWWLNTDRNSNYYIKLRNNDISENSSYGLGYFGNTSLYVGPHHDARDSSNVKDNYFYTYTNISNYIAVTKDNNYSDNTLVHYPLAIRSTDNISIHTLSEDVISRYEMKNNRGTEQWNADANGIINEIYSLINMGSNKHTTNFVDRVTGISGTPTIFDNLFTETIWNELSEPSVKPTDIDSMRNILYGVGNISGDSGVYGKSIGKDVLLTSSRYIYTFGDIVPMVDGLNVLGGSNHRYHSIYVGNIVGAKRSNTGPEDVMITGNLFPTSTGYYIGRSDVENPRWEEINADRLGSQWDYIDAGYIDALNTMNILVQNNLSVQGCIDMVDGLSIHPNKIVSNGFDIQTIGELNNEIQNIHVVNLYASNIYSTPRDDVYVYNHEEVNNLTANWNSSKATAYGTPTVILSDIEFHVSNDGTTNTGYVLVMDITFSRPFVARKYSPDSIKNGDDVCYIDIPWDSVFGIPNTAVTEGGIVRFTESDDKRKSAPSRLLYTTISTSGRLQFKYSGNNRWYFEDRSGKNTSDLLNIGYSKPEEGVSGTERVTFNIDSSKVSLSRILEYFSKKSK